MPDIFGRNGKHSLKVFVRRRQFQDFNILSMLARKWSPVLFFHVPPNCFFCFFEGIYLELVEIYKTCHNLKVTCAIRQ